MKTSFLVFAISTAITTLAPSAFSKNFFEEELQEPQIEFDKSSYEERITNELNKSAQDAEDQNEGALDPAEKKLWETLLDYVPQNGVVESNFSGTYVSLIESTSKDRKVSRTDNFFSVIGGFDEQKRFSFMRVQVGWEDWTVKEDGLTYGDQWLYVISKDGKIAKYWHYHFIKNADDLVVKHELQQATKKEAIAKWDELKKYWYKKVQ